MTVIGNWPHLTCVYPVAIRAVPASHQHVTRSQQYLISGVVRVEMPHSLCLSDRRKRWSIGRIGGRPAVVGTLPYMLEITEGSWTEVAVGQVTVSRVPKLGSDSFCSTPHVPLVYLFIPRPYLGPSEEVIDFFEANTWSFQNGTPKGEDYQRSFHSYFYGAEMILWRSV